MSMLIRYPHYLQLFKLDDIRYTACGECSLPTPHILWTCRFYREFPMTRLKHAEMKFGIISDLIFRPRTQETLNERLAYLCEKQRFVKHGVPWTPTKRTLLRWRSKVRSGTTESYVERLLTVERKDKGSFRALSKEHEEFLLKNYKERPGAPYKNHKKDLAAKFRLADDDCASDSTVRRFLQAQGLFRVKLKRQTKGHHGSTRERLSWEPTHVNQLWHLDAHHGRFPIVDEHGDFGEAKLIVFLDARARYSPHAQWFMHEGGREMSHTFSQGGGKCGLPIGVYTDNGAGMIAAEFQEGLAALGVQLHFTEVRTPEQNGKIERFWGTLESQLMHMIPQNQPITLAELNRYTTAWILQDYHKSIHSELKETPENVFFNAQRVLERRVSKEMMDRAFRHKITRQVHKGTGSVQVDGVRFQLPKAYRHLKSVVLRYARWNLSSIELVDSQSGVHVSDLYPVNKALNAMGRRGELHPEEAPVEQKNEPSGPSPHLERLCEKLDQETGISNFTGTLPL